MIGEKKQGNGLFVIAIILLSFSNVFAISGYANSIYYTEIATLLISLAIVISLACRINQSFRIIDIVLFSISVIFLVAIAFSFRTIYQATNVIMLFGVTFWVNLFSKLNWDNDRYALCGLACSIYSVVMIALFLPGNVLSGWNPNSSISILPVAFFAISCLMMAKNKWKTWAILITIIAVSILVLQLENRSSFLALVLFAIVCLFKKIRNSKAGFRVFYITVISLNILLPFFFEIATSTSLFKAISNVLLDVFDKNGLNGRETLWAAAIGRIGERPLFGTLGYRIAYYHNFSLDILIQFGWIGWIIFISVLVYIFERSFSKNSTSNIFILGFVCLIFLNTFESVLFCNNYFMPFAYLLLGMCWNKKSKRLDK